MITENLKKEIKAEGVKDAQFLQSLGNDKFDRDDSTDSGEAEKAIREFTSLCGVNFSSLTENEQDEIREAYYQGMEQ